MANDGASIFSDVVCELGEGPSYDPATGKLFWFDIVGKKLLEKKFPDGPTIVHDLPFMASAIATIDADRQLDRRRGRPLYPRRQDRRADAAYAARSRQSADPRRTIRASTHAGAFWIGTMAKDEGPKAGAIYWFFKGELRTLYTGISIPNSICFSPDGATAYFTGMTSNVIQRVDCDPATGLPRGEPKIFVDTSRSRGLGRRLGGRCRRRAVERPLGRRRASTPMVA